MSGRDRIWPNLIWPSLFGRIWPNRIWPIPHLAKVNWPHLAILIWPNLAKPNLAKPHLNFVFGGGPDGCGPGGVGARRGGGKGWGPEGLGARRVGGPKGGRRMGPEGWGAQNFALFFLSPAGNFFLSSLCGGFLVEFLWCLKRRDAQMCAFGFLWLSCEAPAARSGWGRRGFTLQPESPNVHI